MYFMCIIYTRKLFGFQRNDTSNKCRPAEFCANVGLQAPGLLLWSHSSSCCRAHADGPAAAPRRPHRAQPSPTTDEIILTSEMEVH